MTLIFRKAVGERTARKYGVGSTQHKATLARAGKTFRADPNEKAVAASYVAAVGHLRDAAHSPRVRAALQRGDAKAAVDALPWDKFVGELTGMRDAVRSSVTKSAAQNARLLLGKRFTKATDATRAVQNTKLLLGTQATLDFGALDKRAIAWAEANVGSLIKDLQIEDRAAVRDIIVGALRGGTTVDGAANLLQNTIGLSGRIALAVQRQYDANVAASVAAGNTLSMAQGAADNLMQAYGERSLDSRAMTIARTEIQTAANQGRAESWQAGVDSGLVGPDATKEWVALDACPECEALDGEIVAFDESFSSGDDMPPAHPNCRCSAVLHWAPGPAAEDAPQTEDAPQADSGASDAEQIDSGG